MRLLANMRAEKRLAALLQTRVQCSHARSFSQSTLALRMTHEKIGSALSLTPATVNRMFSKSKPANATSKP